MFNLMIKIFLVIFAFQLYNLFLKILMKTISSVLALFILLVNVIDSFASNSDLNFINGKVVDERNFPLKNIKVIIGNSEKFTDQNGNFSIPNISTPYDITIAERFTNTAVLYKNLNITNPELILFGDPTSRYSNEVTVSIRFSKIPDGCSAIIKFISRNVSESDQFIAAEGDSTANISVRWPENRSSIDGEIVFLQRTNEEYQFFKRKQISLSRGGSKDVNFNVKKEKKLATSNLKLYFNDKTYDVNKFRLSLNFFNYDRNSSITLEENYGSSEINKLLIPDKFSESFKFTVTGFAESKNGKGFISYNYASPGEALKVTDEIPPEPETPLNNLLAVDGNTRFSYSNGSGAGIYVLEYKSIDPEFNFFIVTGERESYFRYLSRSEFNSSNITFDWRVRKYVTYFNVDDFVKPLMFKNNFTYKAVLYSQRRSFKTGFH